MKPWHKFIEWFGEKTETVGSTNDGRTIRIHMRTTRKISMIVGVDVLCSKCGDWILEDHDAIVVTDSLGSPRNEHKQCVNPC